jgi:hypothetical protein
MRALPKKYSLENNYEPDWRSSGLQKIVDFFNLAKTLDQTVTEYLKETLLESVKGYTAVWHDSCYSRKRTWTQAGIG